MGNNLHSLPEDSERNKWTLEREIEVLVAQGLDISNSFKDVPNFHNNVYRVPKSVLRWGMTFNHFLRVPKGTNGP